MQDTCPTPPGRILVVKLCCLGDAIFLTPALRALRMSYPQAEISWLASSWIRPIVEQIEYVDNIVPFDAAQSKGGRLHKARQTLQLIARLRREKYDAAIIFHRSPAFSVIAALAGIPVRLGFDSRANRRLLTGTVVFEPGRHEVLRYLNLAEALGAPSAGTATALAPSPEMLRVVRRKLAGLGIDSSRPMLALFPGGGENPGTIMTIKRWAPGNWSRLCHRILAEFDVQIALVGGPTDTALNREVLKGAGGGDRVMDIAGLTTLDELPALLAQFAVAVGGDTGPMHISAAVGTRTLLLFGPSDPRLVAPLQENARYLWKQAACSPCYTPERVMDKANFQGNVFGCYTGTHACMKELTVDEVFRALRPWLAELPPRPATG